MITFISWRLEVHFLNGLLFLFNFIFNLLDLLCNLLDKPFHNGIFLIKANKNVQQFLSLILNSNFSDSDLLSDSVKALFDLHLFHDTLLILIVDARVFLFLDFDLFFVLLDLFFKFLKLLLFNKFGLDKLLESDIVLNFVVELGAICTELLFFLFGLLLEMF